MIYGQTSTRINETSNKELKGANQFSLSYRSLSVKYPTKMMLMTTMMASHRKQNVLKQQRQDYRSTTSLVLVLCLMLLLAMTGQSFVFPPSILSPSSSSSSSSKMYRTREATAASTAVSVRRDDGRDGSSKTTTDTNKGMKQKKKKKVTTIGDLKKQILRNPSILNNGSANGSKSKSKRTRKRVENAKQTYMYKAQRIKLQKNQEVGDDANSSDSTHVDSERNKQLSNNAMVLAEARRFGLTNPAGQHCDPLVDEVEPEIIGRILVAPPTLLVDDGGEDESTTTTTATKPSSYAYIIKKPPGWSILGGRSSSNNNYNEIEKENDITSSSTSNEKKKKKKSSKRRVKIIDESGNEDVLEFDEAEIYALLSPEERAELEESRSDGSKPLFDPPKKGPAYDDTATMEIPGWYDVEAMSREQRLEAGIEDEDYDPDDIVPYDEAEVAKLLAAEQEYQEKLNPSHKDQEQYDDDTTVATLSSDDPSLPESVRENLRRIEARAELRIKTQASFVPSNRPSVVSWLKESFASQGISIRGGNHWTAIAGAVDVDDSGLVLLCPKKCTDNLFVDYTEYAAVVGNGGFLAPKNKSKPSVKDKSVPKDSITLDLISKVKKGRDGDVVQTIRIGVEEGPSTCSSIVQPVQNQFDDGVRGDPSANPFDRRSHRRLIHCTSLAVSSLVVDESASNDIDVPDDIKIFSDRLNNHKFKNGSFLGRQDLRRNPLTNAYREINGAADGFPGWTVDRYSEWLFIQHDEKEYRGPVPSIHDGKTAGVYILPAFPDRGAMGSRDNVRPRLMEGRPAPSSVPILENGVTYLASLDRDLSTGIFLDQRPQRAWLTRNCNKDTHVLNCFAHCGAFSVAAATAGASTVSLDLNKKWLDRIPPQLEANGIPFDERHDCIYGDVFEWLGKLAKRGEKYDIVILDPPSSSVGTKKRRWSVKNDFDELVQLAAPLVKKGGLLWTTTNSASISPLRFASLCQKGFEEAGVTSAKLEKIQPSPVDFPSIGPQNVKNFVWRIG